MQKNFLKYLMVNFGPIFIYALILMNQSETPSFWFMLLSSIAIGLISQFAFNKYIEKS